MLNIRRKQGVNTSIDLVLKSADGVAYDLTSALLYASVKTPRGELVADLNISSPEPKEGKIKIETGDTSEWLVGKHEWDIKLVFSDDNTISIPSYGVASWEVIKSVTK